MVAGCSRRRTAALVHERASHVDVVLGTYNVHRAAELLSEAAAHGPITEILDGDPRRSRQRSRASPGQA